MKSKERTFSRRLKDKVLTEMTRQGLNGQRLSQRAQVSDSEISRILNGQSTPGLENATRLARALGVSVDYLADDALDSDPIQASDPVSHEERRILDQAHKLGLARAALLMENIGFIGYETAMQRLLSARPFIEIDPGDDLRPAASPPPLVATAARSNSA